jgi:hypothetical protein
LGRKKTLKVYIYVVATLQFSLVEEEEAAAEEERGGEERKSCQGFPSQFASTHFYMAVALCVCLLGCPFQAFLLQGSSLLSFFHHLLPLLTVFFFS